MSRPSEPQAAMSTRDRILDAAVLRFSRCAYEETGLRDIAADVHVDVAYVHRCFGSKEQLFAEAVRAAVRPERVLAGSSGQLAERLAHELFAHDTRSRKDVGPLDIIVRSLSSPDAARVLRQFLLKDFIQSLADRLDDPTMRRAALIASFLAGVGILRNVLGIEPLCEAAGGELEILLADTIKEMSRSKVRRRKRVGGRSPVRAVA